jgi:hypothetical protein
MFEAKPQAIEAAAKIPTPSRNIERRPNKSPREPPTRIKAPKNNPYDSTTHCTPTTVACRFAWSDGKATLTTVLSMNAMLEPRIVAARIQRRDCAVHGTSVLTDRTTASSHGGFIKTMDASRCEFGSGNSTVASELPTTERQCIAAAGSISVYPVQERGAMSERRSDSSRLAPWMVCTVRRSRRDPYTSFFLLYVFGYKCRPPLRLQGARLSSQLMGNILRNR